MYETPFGRRVGSEKNRWGHAVLYLGEYWAAGDAEV